MLLASLAVTVTVVVPIGKVLPDAGDAVTVVPEQLSVAVGIVYVTTLLHAPAVDGVVILAGHVIVGG